jgi:type I restriction enzyme R subunit
MSRTESQTRFELIDLALIDKRGWSRADIRIEETLPRIDIVYGTGQRRPAGRADYVLCRPLCAGGEPVPLAIMEAKHEGMPATHGLQQGKGYQCGHLHSVSFVFATNGHLFVEYDVETCVTSDERPMSEFPTPDELVTRHLAKRQLPSDPTMLALLTQPYAQGRDYLRYYQDAAVRAAAEKIIRQTQAGTAPRVLLNLATGAGKTRIAAALLRKLVDAGLCGKALFLCDRTELRDNGIGDFQAVFDGNNAAVISTREPQKNAKVLIGTYQTLDHHEKGGPTFFAENYPPGFFDVIVIDECHRSAWGDWFTVLEKNTKAIQIGLTATPREIRWPEPKNDAEREAFAEDQRRVADNLKYFGERAYEYPYLQGVEDGYLAPAEVEAYTVHHDGRIEAEHVRGVKREDLAGKKITELHTGRTLRIEEVPEKNAPGALEARLIMPDRVKAMSEHLFARLLATGENDPQQKTIIFCASDHHADLVTNQLNALYAKWCADQGQKKRRHYAFKCMASVDGQKLVEDLRGNSMAYFVATTKDLLSTGVDVPWVRNIVFFRYLQSAILFAQMFGRGTRTAEGAGKLMFRVFDYTGATALFGKDFITPPPPLGGDGGGGPPLPPKAKARGVSIAVQGAGVFNVMLRDGRPARVTPQEYQEQLTEELIAAVPTLADFHAAWLAPERRHALMEQLRRRGLLPEKVRELAQMEAYDLFDVLAALAYGLAPRSRAERAAALTGAHGPAWLIHLPQPAAKVIRAIARQFERAGTDVLETTQLWQSEDLKHTAGFAGLSEGGDPAELIQKTKETLFVA